ncbi:MAG TPA: glycosyltransferase family 4 protein [Acidimicrobiales bacterium]|nr:glycosyltransferase family 4 protein [Acidimicrobiales bacterium]
MPPPSDALRIALLCYRGNPFSGGQGVYVRHLSRELVALGHDVMVFAGQPWPVLDDGVRFEAVPSLDLYRRPYPNWWPYPSQLKTSTDWLEWGLCMTGQFPEARTFSTRVERRLRRRRDAFDIVHDNQCLGPGLLRLVQQGFPLVATIHHPITVDRDLALAAATSQWQRFTLSRWYSFLDGQIRVARRLPHLITVSESSRRDIAAQMEVSLDRLRVVPVGVDQATFHPLGQVERIPGRLLTTASADVPLKGLVPLLEALAKVRTEVPSAHLVVVGRIGEGSTVPTVMARLGIEDAVEFVSGISDQRLVELYASSQLAVVPSLYEGFSLPAIEAMATGTPLVATTGGALPEVVGADGTTARLVAPGDAGELAVAIIDLLGDRDERETLEAAGRAHVLDRYTWRACAERTADIYRAAIGTC